MEELIRSIKAHLYEKSVSPLAGAFLISTLALNFEVVLILFSSVDYETKFADVDAYFSIFPSLPAWLDQLVGRIVWGLAVPLSVAMAYIIGYPILAEPVYKWTLESRKRLREARQASEETRLLSVEESRKIIVDYQKLERQMAEETEEYRNRNNNLLEEIERLRAEIAANQNEDETTENEDDEDEEDEYSNEQVSEILGKIESKSEVGNPRLEELDGSTEEREQVKKFMEAMGLKFGEKDLLSNQVIRATTMDDRMMSYLSDAMTEAPIGEMTVQSLLTPEVYDQLDERTRERLDDLVVSLAKQERFTGVHWHRNSRNGVIMEKVDMNDPEAAKRERERRQQATSTNDGTVGSVKGEGSAVVRRSSLTLEKTNPEYEFATADPSDTEEIDRQLNGLVRRINEGPFSTGDLVDEHTWRVTPEALKKLYDQRLFEKIERGDFPGVSTAPPGIKKSFYKENVETEIVLIDDEQRRAMNKLVESKGLNPESFVIHENEKGFEMSTNTMSAVGEIQVENRETGKVIVYSIEEVGDWLNKFEKDLMNGEFE